MNQVVWTYPRVMQVNHDGSIDVRVAVIRESYDASGHLMDSSVESLPIVTISKPEIDRAPLQPVT